MDRYERLFWDKKKTVIGIDEAGRGPMAGPLVVCGVILPCYYVHPLINDSKKLNEKQRRHCFVDILNDAEKVIIEIIDPAVIDDVNIYRATQIAMTNILTSAKTDALIDAMPIQGQAMEVISIIKGDQQSISIAAASIVAKVIRDKIMLTLDEVYPQYGFAKHKGYPTKQHRQAIETFGRCDVHRKSFLFKSGS